MTDIVATPPDLAGAALLGVADSAWRPGVWELRDALERMVRSRTALLAWLGALAADADRLGAMQAMSYWHPNGFAKIVLHLEHDSGVRIRLHVWPASDQLRAGESNPHGHRWDFASTVLAGDGLDMTHYADVTDVAGCAGPIEPGEAYTRCRYQAGPSGRATLRPEGPAWLAPVATPTVSAGGIYTCDTSVIHTVMPLGTALVATLLVQGPDTSPSTVVYSRPGDDLDQPGTPLSRAELVGLLGEVRAVLAEAVVNR